MSTFNSIYSQHQGEVKALLVYAFSSEFLLEMESFKKILIQFIKSTINTYHMIANDSDITKSL